MNRARVTTLLIIAFTANAALADSSTEITSRMERVIGGLRPPTAFNGKFADPLSLQERMDYYHTPGVSIAVVNEGKIEWAQGFGLREIGKDQPVTETTVFQAGSVSKPIFALAVMRLVDSGKVDLDTNVNSYLESWKIPKNGEWQPRVTLRQILSHSAGLTVHGFPGYASNEDIPNIVQVLNGESPANTDQVQVNILPGLQFRYSGGGTTVAQLAISDLLDKSFPRLMEELILSPFGMKMSSFEQPPSERIRSSAATAHPSKGKALVERWHIYPEMAAAGLWTTPSDLALAGIEVQKGLRGESELISQESASAMLSPQTGNQNGLGFFIQGEGDSIRFVHRGWDEGFVASFTMYRNHGKGAVIMLNSNEGNPLLREIERSIAEVYDWPGYLPERPNTIMADPNSLSNYVGHYRTESGIEVSVKIKNDSLQIVVDGQAPLDLHYNDKGEFFTKSLNTTISFKTTNGGPANSLALKQAGRTTVAHRKDGDQEP